MSGATPHFSMPVTRWALWLTKPAASVSGDIRAALIKTLFGSTGIFYGGVFSLAMLGLLLVIRYPTGATWAWFALAAVLTVVRPILQQIVRERSRRNARTPTDLYIALNLIWAAALGIGNFLVADVAEWRIICLFWMTSVAMTSGICMRSFGAPRLAMAMLILVMTPLVVAAAAKGDLLLFMAPVQLLTLILTMSSAVADLNRLLVRTMVAEAESRAHAHLDPLTGLLNRRGLADRFPALFAGRPVTLMLLDLDGFKPVNDTLGHAAGDALLADVADRLRDHADLGDLLSRVGGDEFVLVVAERPGRDSSVTANLIIASLASPFILSSGETASIGVSIGMVHEPVTDGFHEPLISDADRALYKSKAIGGGQAFVFNRQSGEIGPVTQRDPPATPERQRTA